MLDGAELRKQRPMRHRLKSLALVVLLGAAGAVWLSAAQEKRKGRRRRRPAPRAAPRRAAAVVLSGGLRTFLHCNGSFFDRVVAENPDFRFDYFVHAVLEGDGGDAAAFQALKSGAHPNVKRVEAELAADARRAVLRELPNLAKLPAGNGTARGKAINVASMFRSIALAEALRAGAAYDVVLRLRPDAYFCSSVNLTAALAVLDEDVVLVPFAEDQLVFDQFAVAGPSAMARYARAYADTLTREIARNPQRALYPEREMWRHFRAEKLKAVTLREFRSTLVRLDGAGAPRHEDAYAKLRLDYPHLARVAMPAPVETCAPRKKRRGG